MSTPLLKQINQEIADFKQKQIQVVNGLTFNQFDTLEQVYYYYLSRFKTGDRDDEGNRKYFENITKNPCKVFSKAIDFDTKNIRVLTVGGGDPLKTWFLERDLKYWLRKEKLGKVLNRLFKELPIFGTVVLKIVEGKPYFVDLRNFIVEQTADDLNSTNYITEIHNLTPLQFRNVAKQMGWEQSKVNEAIQKFQEKGGISHIRVYERYGAVPKEDDTLKGTYSYPWKRIFIADVGQDIYDQGGRLELEHEGVTLSETEFDGHPYWEFHLEKLPGRWLGLGVVESLFEPQIRINELTNLQSKSAYWSALRVFQTRDPNINRNLMSDVRNGEILTVDSEVTQVDMQDRNLAYFNDQRVAIFRNRDEITFSYDVVQGERLPAGTPLGSAQIAIGQTMSFFEQIQEDIAMDFKALLTDVIIPKFEKENSTKHTLRLVGQDLDQYAELIKNDLTLKEVIRLASATGKLPSSAEKDVIGLAVEEAIKQGAERVLEVPKGFYKDLEYDVDIDITGESIDTRVRSATMFAILQAITADPTMTTDPTKRRFLSKMAEDGGVNPNDLFPPQQQLPETMIPQGQLPQRSGGGVSAPQMAQALQGEQTATV